MTPARSSGVAHDSHTRTETWDAERRWRGVKQKAQASHRHAAMAVRHSAADDAVSSAAIPCCSQVVLRATDVAEPSRGGAVEIGGEGNAFAVSQGKRQQP